MPRVFAKAMATGEERWLVNDKSSPGMSSEEPKDLAGKAESAPAAARRVIKRYSNRKLYDTKDSRYVTLLQIAEMVRGGGDEEVQIIDNNTKEDLTEVTLAQIIYEEQKAHARSVPLQTLKELIHSRTEKVLTELREGPIGRLIPGNRAEHAGASASESEGSEKSEKALAEKAEKDEGAKETREAKEPSRSIVNQAKETIEEWQHKVDERVKAVLPSLLPWSELQNEVKRLTERVEELEKELLGARDNDNKRSSNGTAP